MTTTALVLAGCSHGREEAGLSVDDLPSIVLQESDLPPSFGRFDEGRQARADSPGGARADPERFGRLDGWKARFRRAGSPETPGPLVVESRVDAFDSNDGAEQEFRAHREELSAGGALSEAATVGEESVAIALEQGVGATAVRYYTIAWRRGNVTASVVANGFAQRFSLDDALSLAQSQDDRIVKTME